MIVLHTITDIFTSSPGLANHELILQFRKNFSIKTISTMEPIQRIPHLILKIRSILQKESRKSENKRNITTVKYLGTQPYWDRSV